MPSLKVLQAVNLSLAVANELTVYVLQLPVGAQVVPATYLQTLALAVKASQYAFFSAAVDPTTGIISHPVVLL